jgi:hypothetical protein
MNDVQKKPWWQSKTVWAGVATVILVAYTEAGVFFGLPPVPEFVYGILGVLGIYGRVTAKAEVGK